MPLTRKYLTALLLTAVSLAASYGSSLAAGQVVTTQTREWAKKVLADEKHRLTVAAGNSLAVLYFINLTGREELVPLQKGMALMLITDLSQVPGLQLLERIKLQALAEELGLGSSGLVDKATAPRVGRLIGARWIAGGDFTGEKTGAFDTQSRLLELKKKILTRQFSVTGGLEELLNTEKEIVFKLLDTLKITLKPEVASAVRKPCSTNLKALDALFRGIDASDRGDYGRAGDLYQEALNVDPEVCAAAEALQELIQTGRYAAVFIQKKGKTASNESGDDTKEVSLDAPGGADTAGGIMVSGETTAAAVSKSFQLDGTAPLARPTGTPPTVGLPDETKLVGPPLPVIPADTLQTGAPASTTRVPVKKKPASATAAETPIVAPPVESFSLQSALTETLFVVSNSTSLTTQIIQQEVIRQEQPNFVSLTTPVSIRVSFP